VALVSILLGCEVIGFTAFFVSLPKSVKPDVDAPLAAQPHPTTKPSSPAMKSFSPHTSCDRCDLPDRCHFADRYDLPDRCGLSDWCDLLIVIMCVNSIIRTIVVIVLISLIVMIVCSLPDRHWLCGNHSLSDRGDLLIVVMSLISVISLIVVTPVIFVLQRADRRSSQRCDVKCRGVYDKWICHWRQK
jgi:uncharacterized membrane protein